MTKPLVLDKSIKQVNNENPKVYTTDAAVMQIVEAIDLRVQCRAVRIWILSQLGPTVDADRRESSLPARLRATKSWTMSRT